MTAKKLFLLLCATSLFLGTKVNAHDKHSSSDDLQIAGSYVSTRVVNGQAIMDQYILNDDHTVYHHQSAALEFPITTGTFAPDVGTWEVCDNSVIVTVVGFSAAPECAPCCCDINLVNWSRFTAKLSIIDCNTLRSVHRTIRTFALDQNPLTDEGELVGEGTNPFDLKRVPVRPSDLNGDVPDSCVTRSDSCSSSSSSSTSTCMSSSSSSSTSTCMSSSSSFDSNHTCEEQVPAPKAKVFVKPFPKAKVAFKPAPKPIQKAPTLAQSTPKLLKKAPTLAHLAPKPIRSATKAPASKMPSHLVR